MRTLHIDLGARSYDIHIAPGILDRAGEYIKEVCPKARKLYIITDDTVAPLYLNRLERSLDEAGFGIFGFTIIPAGEGSKNAAMLAGVWEDMASFGLTRTDAVIALGGGVVGDLAGFAAATVLRGVDYIQIPTTLLSQVDSSVGGKVAIDLQAGKNLAGAFWQPKAVLIDPDTLNTLPEETFADGMGEVIKYGCIANKGLFNFLLAHPCRAGVMENIEYVLYTCCDLKREVVEEDERDTGRRMLLNFGHTVGHAYEKLGDYKTWTHGHAVAAGMCTAVRMGVRLGLTPSFGVEEPLTGLCKAFNLPTDIPVDDAGWQTVVDTIGLDKKSSGEDLTLIVLAAMGAGRAVKMSKAEALSALAAVYGRG